MKTKSSSQTVLGWQEWLALPDLGIPALKVKVDTGARSSSLHATRIKTVQTPAGEHVQFTIETGPEAHHKHIRVQAPLIGRKNVKSSNGQIETRLTIQTRIAMAGHTWLNDITLTNRSDMRLQMLLGRRSIPKGWQVDPHRICMLPKLG